MKQSLALGGMGARADRGAVSVFLSIVLVPCIAFSSLFVDLSRVMLAKGLAASGGDMALGSLLTHYDSELQGYYGLIASCQDISVFIEQSIWYMALLMGSDTFGGGESNAKTVAAKTANLLQAEFLDAPAGIIAPVENGGLANPALLKAQIVEFMKYRAPLEIAAGIAGCLKGGGAEEALLNVREGMSPVVAEQEILEAVAKLSDYSNESNANELNAIEEVKRLIFIENEGKKANESAKNKGRFPSGVGSDIFGNRSYSPADFPSGLGGSPSFSLIGGTFSGLYSLISDIIASDYASMRDDLFSTVYVMKMFSFATFENEGKHSESLASKAISKASNAAYLAEIEYILYGKHNADNIKSAYGDIYAIRTAMNLASGFMNFWDSSKNATAAAIQVFAATVKAVVPWLPVELIKTIVITALSLMESSKDLDKLEAGSPVELFKTSHKKWHYSFGEEITQADKDPDGGLKYSDYLMLFVLLGFQGKNAETMYERIGDLIQANLIKITGRDSYSLNNSFVYFKVTARIRVKPLMLSLPISGRYSENPKSQAGWRTFEYKAIRGY